MVSNICTYVAVLYFVTIFASVKSIAFFCEELNATFFGTFNIKDQQLAWYACAVFHRGIPPFP